MFDSLVIKKNCPKYQSPNGRKFDQSDHPASEADSQIDFKI
jgi:hypothetical protein